MSSTADLPLGAWLENYSAAGLAVFPCHAIAFVQSTGELVCDCNRLTCSNPGKHPRTRTGVKEATRDIQMVRRWHGAFGDSMNPAIATGAVSDILVIDVDPRDKGDLSWAKLLEEHRIPDTLVQLTGGGGQHYVFRYPTGVGIGNRVGWRPGVDVRSDGGYIVASPADHITGGTYSWKNWGVRPKELPESLITALKVGGRSAGDYTGIGSSNNALKGRSNEDIRRGGFRLGERDDGFNAWIWRLVGSEYPRSLIEEMVSDAWLATDQTGHPFPWARVLQQLDRAEEVLRPEVQARAAGYAAFVSIMRGLSQ